MNGSDMHDKPLTIPLLERGGDVDVMLSFVTPVAVNWWMYLKPPQGDWHLLGSGSDPSVVSISGNARRLLNVQPGTQVFLLTLLTGKANDSVEGDLTFSQEGHTLGSPVPLNCDLGGGGVETIKTLVVLQ
jgi:hypothetical protein